MRPTRFLLLSALGPVVLGALAACGPSSTGGVTASLVIDTRTGDRAGQRGLRAARLEPEIARLEITALTADGSTLASTVLDADPSAGELQLEPAGGTWTLSDVEAGTDRVLRARAFLADQLPPSLAGKLAFAGQKGDIDVVADQVTNAGEVLLTLQPDIRIPRLDTTPPASPGPVTTTSFPAGGALDIRWTRPTDDDVAGYLVAITRSSSVAMPEPTPAIIDLMAGAQLAPGVTVVGWFTRPDITQTSATGLLDNVPYRVFVYAYDTSLEDTALNFSRGAEGLGSAIDTDAPSAFGGLGLAVDSMDPTQVVITFIGPSEDTAGGGAPARYEVRTSTTRDDLTDPARLVRLTRLGPPPVVAPGAMGMFTRTFSALEQRPERGFFLGIRAVDEAENVGPMGIVEYSVTATMTPVITRLSPEVGVAGQPVTIAGRLFGLATGTVTLVVTTGTVTTMTPLTPTQWMVDRVEVTLPAAARSGTLLVTRASDGAIATADLPVLVRLAPPPSAVRPPFAIVSAPLPGRTAAHAIYEAVGAPPNVEQGIRRIFGEMAPPTRRVPFLDAQPPLALAGTYSGLYDRFAFVASSTSVITAGLISTATVPAELRTTLATVPSADGVGLALLAPTSTTATVTAAIPALLAFSTGGRIRTATSADLATDGFGPFTIETSSTTVASGAQLLHVATSTNTSATFIGYRSGTGINTRFGLLSQAGARPGGFAEDAQSMGPPMLERFTMLDVPGLGLMVAYEYRRPDGTIEARLMMQRFLGLGPGFAPHARGTVNRRLEDAGLVYRSGRVWIALATTVEDAGGSRQLNYAEVDPRLALADGYGTTEGVLLDVALSNNPMRAQLGGKPAAVEGVPLIWNGAMGGGQTYLRR